MNKKYNKEVFDFFTESEDRFLMMGKIAQHEPKVKKELIRRFWEVLQQKLEKYFKEKSEDWIVRFSDDWTVPLNKISIYKNEWSFNNIEFPLISVCIESLYENNHPFLGILVDRIGYGNTKFYDVDGINIKLRTTPTIKQLGQDDNNKYWPVWQFLNFQLKDYDNLVHLVPKNAEKTMNFLITDVERYATALEEFMIENDNLIKYKI